MNNCTNCKYQGQIPADPFKNWCYEPTFPTGIIVFTEGECDQWEKGKPGEMPTPTKLRYKPKCGPNKLDYLRAWYDRDDLRPLFKGFDEFYYYCQRHGYGSQYKAKMEKEMNDLEIAKEIEQERFMT